VRDNQLWSDLIDLHRKADALIERVRRKVAPTPAISREVMTVASLEVRWENLPTSYNATMGTGSDAQNGNNVKRGVFTNKGSRIYIREMGAELYGISTDNTRLVLSAGGNDGGTFLLPYYKWNFLTSITQRQYANTRVSSRALGRPESGSHLVFREPFILEPMETLIFEAELLAYGSYQALGPPGPMPPTFVINANFFGYREGM
jgi:hypothetical protein